jgi:Fe-S-cluster containining protein
MKKKDDEKFEIVIPQGAHDGDKPKKMKFTKRTECVRCGTCCTKGSPSLLKADLQLFLSGALSYGDVYTIREGERIRSGEDDEIYESFMELIKIKTKEGTFECIFYREEEGCALYENRPAQCRAYECWSSDSKKPSGHAAASAPYDILEGLEKKSLTRSDIFHSVDVLLEIIKKHEEKCSYRGLSDAFEKLSEGDESAVEKIMDMLQYDTYARPFLKEKFNIPDDAMDLILGRPLMKTINEFGFRIVQEGDEYILLPIEDKEEK